MVRTHTTNELYEEDEPSTRREIPQGEPSASQGIPAATPQVSLEQLMATQNELMRMILQNNRGVGSSRNNQDQQ